MFRKNETKKMNKKDLLELLVIQSKKIDELENELGKANELLKEREIIIKESGSLAEAVLKINKIFEVADKVACDYLENIKRNNKIVKNKK